MAEYLRILLYINYKKSQHIKIPIVYNTNLKNKGIYQLLIFYFYL